MDWSVRGARIGDECGEVGLGWAGVPEEAVAGEKKGSVTHLRSEQGKQRRKRRLRRRKR